jgi:DNA (cytosine-5)-methyltransferase 1
MKEIFEISDLRSYAASLSVISLRGIGGWSYALRLAEWPDDKPVWTGSCPCQPFSAAGKGEGFADERHLWPAFHHLIRVCRPSIVFGEQVEGAINHDWLDLVQDDLEGEGYNFAAAGIPAAGVGAPHIRSRLWWVGDTERTERGTIDRSRRDGWANGVSQREEGSNWLRGASKDGELEYANMPGQYEWTSGREQSLCVARHEAGGGMGHHHHHHPRLEGRRLPGSESAGQRSPWEASDFVWCRDGKWRPVEPGTFPLAHGVSNRMGRLRAYGNAIVPQVAAQFIGAYLDVFQ